MICTSCQANVPSDSAFCAKCGSPVEGNVPVPSDPLLRALEQAVGAQYEIIRLLGRGGMGAVYLARESALDRLVAIKVLPPEGADPEGHERFRREAKTAARLTHPNIVPLHTFGEAHGMMYFVMGYVSGESLSAKLKRKGKIEPDEARRILSDVAAALHYAHEQGVVHRDIKPDNILIEDDSGKPMLTDFGVAKLVAPGETLTQLGATLGTPHYMSPEQAAGDRQIDGRSDLYSLGVVGYQMLSGRLPFEGDSVRDILVQQVTKEPVPISVLDPSIPEDLARVTQECMKKDSAERISDGEAVHSALGVRRGAHDVIPADVEDGVRRLRFFTWLSGGSLIASTNMFYAWILGRLADDAWAGAVFALAGIGMCTIPALTMRWTGKLGRHSWRDVLKWVFRQPARWQMWWPRPLRRPDDMWDQLPKLVKRGRVAQSWFAGLIGSGAFTFPGVLWLLLNLPISEWVFNPISPLGVILLGGAPFGWTVLEAVRIDLWARRIGLPKALRKQLWSAPTADVDFWTTTPLDQYLQAGPTIGKLSGESLPQTPHGYVDAIVRAVADQGAVPKHIAEEAAGLGRQLLARIETLDEQIRLLGEGADPNEVGQLQQKLAALGQPTGSWSDDQRRKRQLVQEQYDLAKRMTDQFERAKERRDHTVEMLKTLWRQIASLIAAPSDTPLGRGEISEKVKALSDDLRRYREASEETVKLLEVKE